MIHVGKPIGHTRNDHGAPDHVFAAAAEFHLRIPACIFQTSWNERIFPRPSISRCGREFVIALTAVSNDSHAYTARLYVCVRANTRADKPVHTAGGWVLQNRTREKH